MKMKPLTVVGKDGVNRTAATLKLIVKSKDIDRVASTKQFLMERLGYTEERANAALKKYS
jgi:hypothetical protein